MQRFAGPPQAQVEVDAWLAPLREWAASPETEESLRPGIVDAPPLPLCAKQKRTLLQGLVNPRNSDRSMLARAIYNGAWHARDKGRTRRYLLDRSAKRRWAPSAGEEWRILAETGDWPTAWLITRLLLDGMPGTATHRPSHLHGPTRCWGCNAHGRPKWRWLSPAESSPSPEAEGVAWCSECCNMDGPNEDAGQGLPPEILSNLPGPPPPRTGAYRVCPLCQQGEAGAEHLVIFCPAVRIAWRTLCPRYAHWWVGWLHPVNHPAEHRRHALRFCHAVAF